MFLEKYGFNVTKSKIYDKTKQYNSRFAVKYFYDLLNESYPAELLRAPSNWANEIAFVKDIIKNRMEVNGGDRKKSYDEYFLIVDTFFAYNGPVYLSSKYDTVRALHKDVIDRTLDVINNQNDMLEKMNIEALHEKIGLDFIKSVDKDAVIAELDGILERINGGK